MMDKLVSQAPRNTSVSDSETARHRLLFAGLGALTLIAFVVSLGVGPAQLGIGRAIGALFGGGGGGETAETARLIMREIRLPRALLGLLIGGALGLSGAALQGYLRNPLAEPGLIGVSGGATLGAVLAIHTGATAAFAMALPLMGLAGALLAALGVLALAGLSGGPLTLILGGVAISSLTGALTSLALNLSANPFAATEMLFWMLGSLNDRSLVHVALAAPLILPGLGLLLASARGLEALTLGDEAAASLGVDLQRTRNLVIAGTALSIGAATAVAGTISFVGLVVPHLLRPLVGHSPARLLPASLLGGAALVLIADVAVRLFPEHDVKLGVLTALIGAPLFAWLVIKSRPELGP